MKFDTLKTIQEEYGEGSSLFILCLMSKYSPMITRHIMKTLSIDNVELDRCPVIYKSLDDPDTPIELSSVFLQRYVDNLIFGYTSLEDQEKKVDYINKKLKPLLINVVPSGATAKIDTSSYFNLNYFDRLNKREDQYHNSSLYNLIYKIYSAGINDKLDDVFLTSDETRDIIEISNIYFGDDLNTNMYVLDGIYHELVKLEPSSKTNMEVVTNFLNNLRNKIKEKSAKSEKIVRFKEANKTKLELIDKAKKIIQDAEDKNQSIGYYYHSDDIRYGELIDDDFDDEDLSAMDSTISDYQDTGKLPESIKMIKSSSLKEFLHKKLTVSLKEAQLIESVIKEYVNKKQIKENDSEYAIKYEMLKSSRNGIEFDSSSDLASFMGYAFPPKDLKDPSIFNYNNYDIESKRNQLKLSIPDNAQRLRKNNEPVIYKSLTNREGDTNSYKVNVVNTWDNQPLFILKKIS